MANPGCPLWLLRWKKIRPKNLPSFPPVSDFDEINIRTYVKSKNKSGVYFLSIEGGRSLSCKVAKGISELPYRYSKIGRTKNHYKSFNLELNDYLDIEFVIGEKIERKTRLDRWLTERYALFQDTANSINEFEIHHLEWPINELEIEKLDLKYGRFDNLLDDEPNKSQYSTGVQVIAWGKEKKEKTGYNKGYNP